MLSVVSLNVVMLSVVALFTHLKLFKKPARIQIRVSSQFWSIGLGGGGGRAGRAARPLPVAFTIKLLGS